VQAVTVHHRNDLKHQLFYWKVMRAEVVLCWTSGGSKNAVESRGNQLSSRMAYSSEWKMETYDHGKHAISGLNHLLRLWQKPHKAKQLWKATCSGMWNHQQLTQACCFSNSPDSRKVLQVVQKTTIGIKFLSAPYLKMQLVL